jgi:hypothetical protein
MDTIYDSRVPSVGRLQYVASLSTSAGTTPAGADLGGYNSSKMQNWQSPFGRIAQLREYVHCHGPAFTSPPAW